MRIAEHMQLIQDMVDEKPNSLGIMLPVDSVKALLLYCADRESLKREHTKERTRANDFTIKYHSMKANYDRLKELM